MGADALWDRIIPLGGEACSYAQGHVTPPGAGGKNTPQASTSGETEPGGIYGVATETRTAP